ncbi:hypothetical protein IF690_21160 [Pseudomonas sp. SK3(2021)]|nr:hypothetical protein [Pseudomonas sp. SK3(2021)]QQZ40506.1 hypothetical protein IF690_21160 [Pseudomonas sp. SK3(2021)]
METPDDEKAIDGFDDGFDEQGVGRSRPQCVSVGARLARDKAGTVGP